MIPVPNNVTIWLATGRTDMRKGMNSLAVNVGLRERGGSAAGPGPRGSDKIRLGQPGRWWGHLCPILANQGVLFSESALKATHFIELACARGIPLLLLRINAPGTPKEERIVRRAEH